jgi:sec-independent protein translocase protein TatB
MPVALKGVTDMIKKARRMAGEFQGHVDEMLREADLGEVRQHFNEIRSFNIKGMVERAVDSDGTLRRTFTENPLRADPAAPTTVAAAPPVSPFAPVLTPPRARDLVAAGIVPPPVPIRPGASPFEVNLPQVGALSLSPPPAKPPPPPFPSIFGDPVEAAPAFVPPPEVAARISPADA